VEVESRVERDGNRIRVIDAIFTSEGTGIARASCVFLRRAENPEGKVWSPSPWDVRQPDEIATPGEQWGPLGPMWDTRVIDNGFGSTDQKRAWLRENRRLADDLPMTPFVRAAFAADFTNPFANSGSAGLKYVNADITLYLHRLPEGEWLGFEVVEHHATDGIALGECALYDMRGAIGRSLVTALANRRKGEG
jgi:acyl-CoA thioesterase